MRKEDIGHYCLLSAVFLAIVAGGHVQIDALPSTGGELGLLLTSVAGLLIVAGVAFFREKPTFALATIGTASLLFALDLRFDLLQGGAAFTTMRVFVAVLVLGGAAYVLATNRVVQMPTVVYAGFLALLVAGLGTSILVSEFRSVSLEAWLNWIVFAAALYLAVATLGRKRGPRALAEIVVLATAIVALKGVYEYLKIRPDEPTYRIFADWNNPNALAGLLVTVAPLAIALGLLNRGLARSLVWAAVAVMVVAIFLTQSLGGLVTLPIGILALAVAAVSWRLGRPLLPALVPLAVAAVLVFAIKATAPGTRAAPPGTAVTASTPQPADEQASSTRFRILLWQGGLELFKNQPVGVGVGAYRFYSAKPGLTEQTHLTHQSFLQIAVEGGVFALVGILGLGIAWIVRMFRGARALDQERNLLRAGVFGAVVACAANGFLESNLYYFGAGLLFFVLLGAGLQLAADGTSPESLPSGLRGLIVALCCVLPLVAAVWSMYVDTAKERLLAALKANEPDQIRAAASYLESVAGPDGESWFLLAWMHTADPQKRLAYYQRAVGLAPSTRHLRGLAQALADSGQAEQALRALERALAYDPNNNRTLMQKLRLEEDTGQIEQAKSTAKRIVAIEDTDYMRTRALAELVPTEPYEARVFLADNTSDRAEEARLLREAVLGYARYHAVTVPKVVQFDRQGLDFLGETLTTAREKLETAREAARRAAELYSSLGDPESAEEMREFATGLTLD